jgi:stalled ribosome rescue protein Dom34
MIPFIGQVIADEIANRDFRLTKAQGWDSVALERVEESTKEGRGAEVGAIVCGEGTLLFPTQVSVIQANGCRKCGDLPLV